MGYEALQTQIANDTNIVNGLVVKSEAGSPGTALVSAPAIVGGATLNEYRIYQTGNLVYYYGAVGVSPGGGSHVGGDVDIEIPFQAGFLPAVTGSVSGNCHFRPYSADQRLLNVDNTKFIMDFFTTASGSSFVCTFECHYNLTL